VRGPHICVILYVHKHWDARVNCSNYTRQLLLFILVWRMGYELFVPITSLSEADGSRREELNTPSTDYDSVALTLSYTGELIVL
jgi:hypothetical protein